MVVLLLSVRFFPAKSQVPKADGWFKYLTGGRGVEVQGVSLCLAVPEHHAS